MTNNYRLLFFLSISALTSFCDGADNTKGAYKAGKEAKVVSFGRPEFEAAIKRFPVNESDCVRMPLSEVR